MVWAMKKVAVSSILLGVVLLAVAVIADAQQPKKIYRIGYLSGIDAATHSTRSDTFRQTLRELGYIEGQNIIIEYRYAEGKLDRLPELAAELVRLKVDIVLSSAPPPTRAAKSATATIPIVMAFDDDPVRNGFVATLARPGGNITGLSSLAPEISGKQLELLKEIVPQLARLALIATSTLPIHAQMLKETQAAARAIGVKLQYLDVLTAEDIETVFRAASSGRADAVLVRGGPLLNSHRIQIIDLAIKSRLPAMHTTVAFVEDGGLMTYTASQNDLNRRAATYVDKILKGAKPADLPVQQPTKFELVINLKTAKQIGLIIPPNVLARADRVIK
jgi:putative tryptophan/tyrosine transport system substrate-binding protein